MDSTRYRLTRRQVIQRVGVAGLGLLTGCTLGTPPAESPGGRSHTLVSSPERAAPALLPAAEADEAADYDRLAVDILGGHDTPNTGRSRDIRQFVADLHALGMRTAVCIDPSPKIVEALNQAGIRLIVRLVQQQNLFNEQNIAWTLRKLRGVRNVSIQPFNEPSIEGAAMSPEDHIRYHFMKAARIILPAAAPHGGTLLLTPLAPYASFHGIAELEAYRRMLMTL